jgi:voltage-gated potassium channel
MKSLSVPAPEKDAPNSASRAEISVTYELFSIIVTVNALAVTAAFYLLPVPLQVKQVLYILDSLNAFILLVDFCYRFYCAPSRSRYFVTHGWLDLIGGLPGVPALRLARVPTLTSRLRWLRRETPQEVRQDARKRLASSTLLSTIIVVLLVVTIGSILVVLVEKDAPNGNIVTGGDAVWWSVVTVSTVGYGDRYPTTPAGRLIGVAMMVVGVSMFTVLTSFIATNLVSRRHSAEQKGETDALRDEIVRLFAEQQRSEQEEASALRAELAELRRLIAQAKPDRHDES